MPSAPLGKILTDPMRSRKCVPSSGQPTVLAGGNVIAYAAVPAQNIMFPENIIW